MDKNFIFEAIGYLGSLLVVVSMLMTSVKKLRVVNTVGSTIFTVYALLIHSYPTALMNTCLVVINIVNLVKLVKAEKCYNIIECYKDESIVQLHLKSNLEDIKKYFPDFNVDDGAHTPTFLVCTGSMPIGITIGKIFDDKSMTIELDYTLPSHRDYSVGKYLFSYLKEKYEIKSVSLEAQMKSSDPYLEKLEFKNENGTLRKIL